MPSPDLQNFDPNSAGNHQNTIFGLPFSEDDARLVIIPVPWDATVSYREGAALGPQSILESSYQVDLYDRDAVDTWRQGIYMCDIPEFVHQKSLNTRELVLAIIEKQENGEKLNEHDHESIRKINTASTELNEWVQSESEKYLKRGQHVVLLGGDHSAPLGYMKALAGQYPDMSILQIDAHMDLRRAYEGFTYSHASIMYNMMMEIPSIHSLVQVGLRDFCDEEIEYGAGDARIHSFFDQDMKSKMYRGASYESICRDIIAPLSQDVYISMDIDGLRPDLCPHTGTPVPGGLEVEQLYFLLETVIASGRRIVGFDLSEVATDEDNESIDSIIGARILYKLSIDLLKSHG